jgi:lipid-binding SYLF domain-containing protein
MKRLILALVCLGLCGTTLAKEKGSDSTQQLAKATAVVNEIMRAPESSIPRDLPNKAVCVGIVPSEIKLALGIGGAYGRGVLIYRKGGNGPWGVPSMFTLGGANIGFQIGGKATDRVFLVMNPEGARKWLQDDVKLDTELSGAAGPVGRSSERATGAQLHTEILSYSRSRGLFAGASLDGAVVKQDKEDNEQLYGRKVEANDILIKGSVPPPAAAGALRSALNKYSPRGGEPFSNA